MTDTQLADMAKRIRQKHLPWDEFGYLAAPGGVLDQLQADILAALKSVQNSLPVSPASEIEEMLHSALQTARDTIQELYWKMEDLQPGMPWEVYVANAPEMHQIDAALRSQRHNEVRHLLTPLPLQINIDKPY